jgi:small subunit ribosomal protein S16
MPVRIRLTRMGSKRRPFYRIVVVDSRGKRDGGFLEQIGQYNPIVTPHEFKLDEEKVFEWLKKGAQLSDGARDLLKKHGTLRKWDAVRRGLPIPPEPEKVIEVKASEEKPAEEPVEKPAEETGTPEPVEEAKAPEKAEASEPAEPVKAEAAEPADAPEPPEAKPPEATTKPEDTSTP